METTRPPGFPGNPPARMPRAPTPARSPPPRPLRCGERTFRPTHDVGPHKQCISGLNHAAYGLPVNASRPGSPQAHASLGSGWRPTLAGWDWIPTGFRTRFQRSHHGILFPLTGLSGTRVVATIANDLQRSRPADISHADAIRHRSTEVGHSVQDLKAEESLTHLPRRTLGAKTMYDDRLVLKERVLHPSLTVVTGHLLQRRCPSFFTALIVRSRAGNRGPWQDTFAVLTGGTRRTKRSEWELRPLHRFRLSVAKPPKPPPYCRFNLSSFFGETSAVLCQPPSQLDCEHDSPACRGCSVTPVGAGGLWPDPQLD